jgi:hypothetical protein
LTEKLRAASYVVLFYIVVPTFGAYALWQGFNTSSIPIAIFGVIYVVLSIYMAQAKTNYDSKTLNTIRIEEAPLDVTRLLSETTNRGVLINQLIIETLSRNRRGMSQTDLIDELPISSSLRPTREMVRIYVTKLEKKNIIKDVGPQFSEAKRKIYVLTKKGEWCVEAIKKYYPKYYVSFLIRNLLRTRLRKRLPQFESIKEI